MAPAPVAVETEVDDKDESESRLSDEIMPHNLAQSANMSDFTKRMDCLSKDGRTQTYNFSSMTRAIKTASRTV